MRTAAEGRSGRFVLRITILFIIGISFLALTFPGKTGAAYAEEVSSPIPCLVDLGAGKCIPCKQMKPILEELETEYVGKFEVVFYDVWEDPKPAKEYGIHAIPTQIFLDEKGKELFRHVGFFSKEDILNTWEELGYDFD
jgi:thioredoxin 1